MGFFTPWFLAGAVGVGLPIWLHLLKKHKTTPCRSAPDVLRAPHTKLHQAGGCATCAVALGWR